MALLAEKDVDDTMAADWAAIQEKHAVPEEEAAPVAEAEPEVIATEEQPAAPAKPRDESGKFVKPAKVAAPIVKDSKQPVVAKAPIAAEPETPEQPTQVRDVNRAPSTWKPAIREEWAKLTPTVRAEIHRREADFQHGQAQLLPDARFGQQLRQIIDPYKMLIEADGGTPERAVSDLMRTAATLRIGTDQEKLNALIGIVKQYRIDLRPLLNGQPAQQQPQQEFRDSRVDQLLARQQADEQQRTVAQSRDLETAVTSFLSEVDATGNPKREYLGEVMNDMTALLPQIQAANPGMTHTQALEAAYDRAIWAHPEVRTVLQTRQQTELQQQRTADNQLRVRDAKRAASVNVPRRASIPSPSAPGKLEETIRDTARELGLFT